MPHLLHVVNVVLKVPDCAPREGGRKILEGGEGEGVKGVTLQVPECAPRKGGGKILSEGKEKRGRGELSSALWKGPRGGGFPSPLFTCTSVLCSRCRSV